MMARDYEYIRHGTLSLFACIDLITGKVYHNVFEKSRSREFIEIMKEIVSDCQDTKIVVILDNYATYISEETKQYLSTLKKGKLKFVFTPKHASWLNIIESFFSKMSRGFLKAIRVESVEELKRRIDQYINLLNEEPVVFLWKYKIEGEDKILVEFQYERNMQLIWNRCTSYYYHDHTFFCWIASISFYSNAAKFNNSESSGNHSINLRIRHTNWKLVYWIIWQQKETCKNIIYLAIHIRHIFCQSWALNKYNLHYFSRIYVFFHLAFY